MKVAVDAQLLGPRPGGVEGSILNLLRHLPDVCDGQIVVYVPADYDATSLDSRLKIKRSRARVGKRFSRVLFTQFSLAKELDGEGVSLLHSPAYVTALNTDKPVVLTAYDTIGVDYPSLCGTLSSFHLRLFFVRSLRKAKRIIVPTEYVRKRVGEITGEEGKVVVAPLGVDERFKPVEKEEVERVRKKYELPEDYILFVGNLEPKKNLPLLIEAHKRLLLSGLKIHLVIAGKRLWGYRDAYHTTDKLAIRDFVHFPGYIAREDIPGLYSGAELFVFPSVAEGFGLPPLEAMACGVPVVTSSIGALLETTGDSALHCELNSSSLCEVIKKVLGDDKLRSELKEKGLRRSSQFRWRRYAEQVASVYAEVFAR